MAIIKTDENIFILETNTYHYVFGVGADGLLYHIHFGEKADYDDYEINIVKEQNSNYGSLDFMNLEYSGFGLPLYRECSFKCEFSDKTRDVLLIYKDYKINENSLTVTLKDEHYKLEIELNYTIDEKTNIITKNATIKNVGEDFITLDKAFSGEFSFPSRRNYNVYNSNGTWNGENQIKKQELSCGNLVFESRKGTSSHGNSPSFIIAQNETETSGEVYFATLAYSGSFKVNVGKDGFSITRAVIGMNDFDFSYTLNKNECLETPKIHFGYAKSLSQMSNNMNDFAINNVFPKNFSNKELPVIYNSWEATGFDVEVAHQKKLAQIARDIGVETFVIDDGWFGERNNDDAGLGDWFVNKEKFPNGLGELIGYVNELGMDFGIWVEPEMVNPDSELFRNHPEWAYHYDNRKNQLLRNQLVLNMTNEDVKKYIFNCLDELLENNNIKYVKWDMNRPFSQIGTDNLENGKMLWYLHTKAVYEIVDELKKRHKNTQFEACASGGGRCDYGAFEHFDEIWTSDNTDAVDRIDIQNGFSLLNPTKAMRTWVTDHGNAPIDFKCNIAMQGSLGIGVNLLKSSNDDLSKMKSAIEIYKNYRNVIQFGNRYRLMNLNQDEINVNQYVSKDMKRSIVFIANPARKFEHFYFNIKLNGLKKDSIYALTIKDETIVKSGSYFMNVGIDKKYDKIFLNEIWTLEIK